MKSAIITGLLLGYLSIAVFGFIGMRAEHSMDGSPHVTCLAVLASVAQGGIACPQQIGANSVGFALFHVKTYKGFSTAVVNAPLIDILLAVGLMVLLAAGTSVLCAHHRSPYLAAFTKRLFRIVDTVASFARELIMRWLALFEHSPSYA